MIKYAGIILISGAISMYGAHKASAIRQSVQVQKALYELIIFTKGSIENGSIPLSEIFRLYNSKPLKKCGFTDILKSGRTDAFSCAFEGISQHFPEKLSVLYTSLGEKLGKSRFAVTECETLERYIQQIKTVQASVCAEEESKIQLYRKLGVLAGLLAALILI